MPTDDLSRDRALQRLIRAEAEARTAFGCDCLSEPDLRPDRATLRRRGERLILRLAPR